MFDTIGAKITLKDFDLVVANHSRGKDFSKPAIEAIFDEISKTQSHNKYNAVSINSWLISAGEQTSGDLANYLMHLSYENTEDLIDAAKDKISTFENNEIDAMLDAYRCHDYQGETIYSDDIWEVHQTTMLENEKFVVLAAEILAKASDEHFTKLSNDNWITFS